jgi:hypothetical protein
MIIKKPLANQGLKKIRILTETNKCRHPGGIGALPVAGSIAGG